MILVDTNALLRMAQPSHSMYQSAVSVVSALSLQGEKLCIVPQVLYEYWVVATRPLQQNGLGLSAAEASADLAKIVQRFALLRDEQGTFDIWLRLVTHHSVLGNAHDARLVAAMESHGMSKIISFDSGVFQRFANVAAIDPNAFAKP